MKISGNSFAFVEAPPAAAGSKGGAEFGDVFESAIRDAEKQSPGKLQTDGKAPQGREEADSIGFSGDPGAAETPEGGATSSKSRESMADVRAASNADDAVKRGRTSKEGEDQDSPEAAERRVPPEAAERAEASPPADGASTIDILGRLIAASLAAERAERPPTHGETVSAAVRKAAAAPAGDRQPDPMLGIETAKETRTAPAFADVALEERIVVVPLGSFGSQAASAAADTPRSKANLEVLHMETHFEPRSDAVVLVEGKVRAEPAEKTRGAKSEPTPGGRTAQVSSAAGDAIASDGETQLRLSFDEALARLGDASGDKNARRGSDAAPGSHSRYTEADTLPVRLAAARTPAANDLESAGAVPTVTSMTEQVAGRILDALGTATPGRPQADLPAGGSYLRMTAGGAALKTLTIQLQPENLGRLDVSMRLVEGQLTLELAATEASTAKVLAEDQEGLRKLLSHAGFSLDDASITIISRDPGGLAAGRADASGDSAARPDGGGPQQDESGSEAGDRDASDRREGRPDESRRGRRGHGADETAPARPRSSTYL